MTNRDVAAAWRYHDATKHSFDSVRSSGHRLDWSNQPLPFKLYRALEPIPLPREVPSAGMPALEAIAAPVHRSTDEVAPDLNALAYLLFYSAGITKRKQYPGGEMSFRAASCTGALYEIELYLASGDLAGLPAGVYHFGPADFALRRLRAGDFRTIVVGACAGEPAVVSQGRGPTPAWHAPVYLICTGTYWRNAWKYQARTYRHFGWDNGTILANLLAAAAALRVPARVVSGFVDRQINDLLAVDTAREVAFSIVALGQAAARPPDSPPVEPIAFDYEPVSRSEVDYPIMRATHEASSLQTREEVAAWRVSATSAISAPPAISAFSGASASSAASASSLEDVILRRGSTRRFARGAAWTGEQLSTALRQATRPIDADFAPEGALLNDLYLIVHAVDGLTPGSYFFDRAAGALVPLKAGDFRADAGYLGLEQDLPADGSVVVFFLADLGAALNRLGNRGYRAAQLEAGILGGRLYLAAYAQRLGASGLTFYDDDVVQFFSPHAAGKSAMFCVALGKSRAAMESLR